MMGFYISSCFLHRLSHLNYSELDSDGFLSAWQGRIKRDERNVLEQLFHETGVLSFSFVSSIPST